MQNVPQSHWETWYSGNFTGPNRPITRAIIQRGVLSSSEWQTGASTLPWRSILFNSNRTVSWKEIPNIQTCSIDRRLGADAATMQLVFDNQIPVDASTNLDLTHAEQTPGAAGPSRRELRDLGFPGHYTYTRGTTPYSTGYWGHPIDPEWMDEFIPNRVIITFQGYGTDGSVNAWQDTALTQTGVWLIDEVEYTSDAKIKITCRDLAKLAIMQRLYPPIIPLDKYPLILQIDHTENVLEEVVYDVAAEGTFQGGNVVEFPVHNYNSSNAYYFADKTNGGPCGHGTRYAFDPDETTYWQSIAHSTSTGSGSYEWLDVGVYGDWVKRIRILQKWGNYRIYVSFWGTYNDAGQVTEGWWAGPTIPYAPVGNEINNGAAVPYQFTFTTPAGDQWVEYDFDFHYRVQIIRLTFTNLYPTTECPSSVPTPHRAAVRAVTGHGLTLLPAAGGPSTELVEKFVPGNMWDYTDIIKLFCAWSGWYWPEGTPNDRMLSAWAGHPGRVWGDFEYSGAYPVEPPVIDPSYWDNKSVMDGINQIKEILGFIFYVDATGAVVWRSPNIWNKGNFVTGVGYVAGENAIEVVDEDRVLIDYGVTIGDENLRSEIIVVAAPSPDESSALSPGWAVFTPGGSPEETIPEAGTFNDLRLLGGQERIMIVPDYPFITQEEILKFGYLVSLWMHWSYRTSRFRIPGMAAFEPDDQIRIFERVSSESFVHYIQGVSSVMDMKAGTWYMDLETHWLGEGPGSTWLVNFTDLATSSPALAAFLLATGRISAEEGASTLGPGFFQLPPPPTMADGQQIYNDILGPANTIAARFPDPPPIADADPAFETYSPNSLVGSYTNPQRGSYAFYATYWGTRCSSESRAPYTLVAAGAHANQPASVLIYTNARAIEFGCWKAMRAIIIDLGIRIYPSGCTASYACRQIAGSTKWSNHAWGIAIDINPCLGGGWGVYYNPSTAPPPHPQALALANNLNSRVKLGTTGKPIFGWGGNWSSLKDYMHFEIQVSPDELKQHGVYIDGSPIGREGFGGFQPT